MKVSILKSSILAGFVSSASFAEDVGVTTAPAAQEQAKESLSNAAEIEVPKPLTDETKAQVQEQEKATPPPATTPVAAEKLAAEPVPTAQAGEVSDGARISLDSKGFSIAPPTGWTVHRDLPKTSLLLSAPADAQIAYPRNISVMRVPGSVVLDEHVAEKFADLIVKNVPAASPEIADYALRNHQPIQMADGRQGILYYTDFKVRDKAMMQAHVLVSSETAHYIVSYTDLAEHFENAEMSTKFLGEAWNSVVSIQLDSASPNPMEGTKAAFYGVIALVAVGSLIVIVRKRRASKLYSDFANLDPDEAADMMSRTETKIEKSAVSSIATKISSLPPTAVQKAKVIAFSKKQKSQDYSLLPSDLKTGKDEEIQKDQWKVS